MKRTIAILSLLTLFACDGSLQITSTKKQTIIPGIRTSKPFSKYLLEVEVNSGKTIKLDSVLVFEKEKEVRKTTPFIRDQKTNNVVAEVNVNGKYLVVATVTEKSPVVQSGEVTADKIVVYYKENNHNRKIEITSFTEETVRKR